MAPGGIGARAWQMRAAPPPSREISAHLSSPRSWRLGMEVAGAGVIAKPRPRLPAPSSCFAAASARFIGPAFQEFAVIARHRLHGEVLLQHDFRKPDPVRIGPLTFGCAPGQHPAVAVVPGQQFRGQVGNITLGLFDFRGACGIVRTMARRQPPDSLNPARCPGAAAPRRLAAMHPRPRMHRLCPRRLHRPHPGAALERDRGD